MTHLARLAWSALVVVACALPSPALADGNQAPAPPPAQAAPKPWLAPSTPGPVASAPPTHSAWRTVLLLLFVAGVGGTAVYLRYFRRQGQASARVRRLEVLDVARIGPKAQLVLASVGGKTILLGVTDTAIRRLAWLREEPRPIAAERVIDDEPARTPRELVDDDAVDDARTPGPPRAAERRPSAAPERPSASPPASTSPFVFGDMLKRVLRTAPTEGRREPVHSSSDAALRIADRTTDVVERSPALRTRNALARAASERPPTEPRAERERDREREPERAPASQGRGMEEQASGLAARRRRP